jgi:hypothetical protein
MLLAHANGSYVWNIHMSNTYTYVKCTFPPHPNSQYFIYFNVKCTKLGAQVRYHIVWIMIPLMLLKSHHLIFWFSCNH